MTKKQELIKVLNEEIEKGNIKLKVIYPLWYKLLIGVWICYIIYFIYYMISEGWKLLF